MYKYFLRDQAWTESRLVDCIREYYVRSFVVAGCVHTISTFLLNFYLYARVREVWLWKNARVETQFLQLHARTCGSSLLPSKWLEKRNLSIFLRQLVLSCNSHDERFPFY